MYFQHIPSAVVNTSLKTHGYMVLLGERGEGGRKKDRDRDRDTKRGRGGRERRGREI